jgi:hypothetical protein
MYSEGDHIALKEIGQAKDYYIRLCFRDINIKRRSGRIVNAPDVDRYVTELAEILAANMADLMIQPFIVPSYSGAVLKLGHTIYIEAVYGIAPTLFHKGRFSYRAIFTEQRLIYSETTDQGIALLWKNGSVVKAREPGWIHYDPKSAFFQIAAMLNNLDNVLLEWSMVDDSIIFFDHKDLPLSSDFWQLREKPPLLPRCVTTSMEEVKKAPLPKRVLFLNYPDFGYISQARASDFVVIKRGALLSHVSVYSIYEDYKCVFHK